MSSKKTKIYKSFSSEETREIGKAIAKEIGAGKKAAGALVLALKGDLGAGKTTFTQGLMSGLGSKRRATSPTFIIMRRYPLKKAKFKNVFHIDAYRLASKSQLEVLGIHESLKDPKNLLIIEWPEKVKGFLPKGTVSISFRHGKKENERTIILKR